MTLMPARTDRLHLEPYWYGDSPRAIKQGGSRRSGHRDIDLNLQRCKDGVAVMHWATPAKNGYLFIIDARTGKRRPMTRIEAHRKARYWTISAIKRWRRTARRGLRYRSRVHIMSYEEALHKCVKYNARPCFELKSASFADKNTAIRMVKYAKSLNKQTFFMTLVTMRDWRGKGKAFKEAGGHIALLAHGAPKPPDLADYVPEVFDRVWGSFR